jgi:hypothetical protein
MKAIGTLLLENGGWIIDDVRDQELVYRSRQGAPTFIIPYILTKDECILGRDIATRVAGEPPGDNLPEWQTNDLLKEIIEHLQNAGISARIAD